MIFNSFTLETMLGGSHVAFKSKEHQPLSGQEQELKYADQRRLQDGIYVLRKLRTQALGEPDATARQNALTKAQGLSTRMAEVILTQASVDKPSQIEPSFLEALAEIKSRYEHQEADSGHYLPAQFSIGNLFRAADDMLARIEEKAQSICTPDHKLIQGEMVYVLHEFLRGTNDLNVNAVQRFFERDTRVGGILSGGSVYLEMVKKIIDRYADPSLTVYSFVVAVDKKNKEAVFETSGADKDTRTVIIVDDMINTGSTVITALWSASKYFPNATIYSGKGTDQAGGFAKRSVDKHMQHLEEIFQDFADLSENGQKNEALTVFRQAEEYAQRNNVRLQPGWYRRKERLERV